jgi:hypothetical protein
MALLAVIAAVVLCVAFAIRENQLGRERRVLAAAIEELRGVLDMTRMQLRRTGEDLYVTQTLLTERNVLDENDMARARLRLIEAPRRMAEERAQMARHLKVSPTQLLIDQGDPKVH